MGALESEKQEKFVQNLIKGMSQRKAYRDAYPDDTSKDEVVDVNASRLFHDTKVALRYQEIISDQIIGDVLLTRWEKRKILADIARDSESSASERTKAIDTDNKMENEYVNRIEVSKPIDESVKELEEYIDKRRGSDGSADL